MRLLIRRARCGASGQYLWLVYRARGTRDTPRANRVPRDRPPAPADGSRAPASRYAHLEDAAMDGTPQRWWQWVLMYPTIVLALGGAIPQYYQWISAAVLGLSPFAD